MPRFVRSSPESVTPTALLSEQELTWETNSLDDLELALIQDADPELQALFNKPTPDSIEIGLKRQKRRAQLHGSIACAAAVTTIVAPFHAYARDVIDNKIAAAESTPTIDSIPQKSITPLSPEAAALLDPEVTKSLEALRSTSAIFYLAGFDTADGSIYGKKLSAAIHQISPGDDESINYGEAPLDSTEIGKKIIEHAERQGITRITLSGNSLGGYVALETALYIMEHSDIEVEAIINNSTPAGSEGLLPNTKRDLATMMNLLKFPESKYSDAARAAATIAQESPRFNDGNLVENFVDFWKVFFETQEAVQEKRRPGMWLLVDQALAINNVDLKDIIKRIGALRGEKHIPILIYMRAENPKDDTVVDVEKSGNALREYAEEADIQFEIAYVEGQRHTSYDFNSDAFAEALAVNGLAQRAREGIASERTYYAVARLGLYDTENITAEK